MNTLVKMYSSLLADVRQSFRVPLGLPDDITLEWVLIEAPKLDKLILKYLETGGEVPPAPEWIKPLVDYTLEDPRWRLGLLRTLLNFGYKAEYEPTQQQIKDAEEAFLDVEAGIETWDSSHEPHRDPFLRRVRTVIHRVLSRIREDDWQASSPHHGPGAVYPRFDPEVRSKFATVYDSIAEFYCWDTWFRGVFIEDLINAEDPWVDSEKDIICNMTAVPKDSRGPRLICVHPREAIWIQQSQRQVVERAIMSSKYTKGFINFKDQSVNQGLALASSLHGYHFTLDLKEASDRLSKKLVDYLLGSFAKRLSCARATHVRLLSGRTVALRKWAPMGNCLTFPVESLIFWALAHVAISTDLGSDADADVYVFGDDIVAPSDTYEVVLRRLVQVGLVPNRGKTFKDGSFRESCGVDAYSGVDNTPLRTKTGRCLSYADAESLCSVAKAAEQKGFSLLSVHIYGVVSRFMESKGKQLYSTNNPDAGGISKYAPVDFAKFMAIHAPSALKTPYLTLRKGRKDGRVIIDSVETGAMLCWNNHLHRWESAIYRAVPVSKVRTDSWWNLLDGLIKLENNTQQDAPSEQLAYAVPNRHRLQLGWTPVVS